MSRSTTRIQNLTKAQSLSDNDVIPFGPESGDRAKGIIYENLKAQLESDLAGQIGWEFLIDTEYPNEENGFDIDADTWVRIPNSGFQLPQATNLPEGISSYYDASNDKFVTPIQNQWFNFSINFAVVPSTANATIQVRGLIDTQPSPSNFYGPTVQPLAVDAGETNIFSIATAFPITQLVADNGFYYEVNCSADATLFLSAYLLSSVVEKNDG